MADLKAEARKAALARRAEAAALARPGAAGKLSEVLAGYRGAVVGAFDLAAARELTAFGKADLPLHGVIMRLGGAEPVARKQGGLRVFAAGRESEKGEEGCGPSHWCGGNPDGRCWRWPAWC